MRSIIGPYGDDFAGQGRRQKPNGVQLNRRPSRGFEFAEQTLHRADRRTLEGAIGGGISVLIADVFHADQSAICTARCSMPSSKYRPVRSAPASVVRNPHRDSPSALPRAACRTRRLSQTIASSGAQRC